jgi:hypothetical protein
MPISAKRMKEYPGGSINSVEWRWIRLCSLLRADFRCEGTPRYPDCRAEHGKPHPQTGSKVVLTIMHLDHDLRNDDPSNFKAGCQRCHLTYDASFHAKNAARTRREKSPQLDLVDLIGGMP